MSSPAWIRWNAVASRLITAAVTSVPQGPSLVRQDVGYDLSPLLEWVPTPVELARIRQAHGQLDRVRLGLTSNAVVPAELEGDGPRWAVLRGLAAEVPPGSRPAPAPAARVWTRRPAVRPSARDATEVTVYLDETWLAGHSVGLLAGLVWFGEPPSDAELPRLPTHLLQSGSYSAGRRAQAERALTRLRELSEQCLPFVMPIGVPAGENPARLYDDLVAACLLTLLGWVLPGDGPLTAVRVFLERFEGREGQSGTAYFKGALFGAGLLDPERFRRWHLQHVEWCEKEFEYVPYGDLLAYLGRREQGSSRELFDLYGVASWPGYLPLSLDLVPRLVRLGALQATGNVADVLDLAAEQADSELGRRVLAGLAPRLAAAPALQQALLERLDGRLRAKDRDMARLRPQVAAAFRLVPVPEAGAGLRLHLLRAAVELQRANHDGNPAAARDAVARCEALREPGVAHDPDLVAFLDLLRAVHLADRLEFGLAEVVAEGLIAAPFFPHLPARTRGRARSSRGQYLALLGDQPGAEREFVQALALFAGAGLGVAERAAEEAQTGCYRALAALDADRPEGLALAEAVLGPLPAAAARLAASAGSPDTYQQHLLLRCLWHHPDRTEPALTAYLAARPRWRDGTDHPWPLIHLYRALLLLTGGDDQDLEAGLRRALEAADARPGTPLEMIALTVHTVARCCGVDGPDLAERREALLARCAAEPAVAARTAVERLRGVLAAPDLGRIDEALGTLGLYYR